MSKERSLACSPQTNSRRDSSPFSMPLMLSISPSFGRSCCSISTLLHPALVIKRAMVIMSHGHISAKLAVQGVGNGGVFSACTFLPPLVSLPHFPCGSNSFFAVDKLTPPMIILSQCESRRSDGIPPVLQRGTTFHVRRDRSSWPRREGALIVAQAVRKFSVCASGDESGSKERVE